MRTTLPEEDEDSGVPDTALTQNPPDSDEAEVKQWPKKVKHRKKVLAKIYPRHKGRDAYRVAWSVGGKRQMKSFCTYSGEGGAKEYAESLVKDLAKGSQATALTAGQVHDALTAQQAGNAPAMVPAHYKGLATKAEAQKWFAVRPARSASVISLPVRKNAH